MIPKVIHYCWFGGNELPETAKKCIASWKKYCPDYEIKRWDESNYDVNKNDYTRLAYKDKKWAFLTDYVRLDILNTEGGMYLDTDVQLIKSINPLLKSGAFMAFEQQGRINTGIGFACEPNNPIVSENKKYYEDNNFLNANGDFIPEICVKVTTKILINHGLKYKNNSIQSLKNITIYPSSYFSPKKMGTNKVSISSETYGIHLFASSWYSGPKFIKTIKYHMIGIKEFIKYKILKRKLYE